MSASAKRPDDAAPQPAGEGGADGVPAAPAIASDGTQHARPAPRTRAAKRPPARPVRPKTPAERFVDVLARPATGLPLFVLAAGLVSVALGIDAGRDLLNRHFYAPWALLNHRVGLDFAPAGVASYANPLQDLPFYALVTAGFPAWTIAFALAVPCGIGAYFFLRIARRVVIDLRLRRGPATLLALCAVAFTGTASLSLVGATSNQWLVAALVLPALFLLLREGRRATGPSRTMFALQGLLLGLAAGLQPAAGIYAAAVGVAALVGLAGRPWRLRVAITFVVFVGNGFLIADGYWAAWLTGQFRNPVFPYFNDYFRSEWWEAVDVAMAPRRPDTLAQWLTWPFALAENNRMFSDVELREPRLAALCVVAAGLAVAAIGEVIRGRGASPARTQPRLPRSVRTVAAFTAVSYGLWLLVSADYRDTLPAELMASLLLVAGMAAFAKGARHRSVLVGAACIVLVAAALVPDWGRVRAGDGPYFDVHVPLVTPDALVLSTTDAIAYVTPMLPAGARVLRPAGRYRAQPFPNRLQKEMHATVAAHAGPLFVLRRADAADAEEDAMLAGLALDRIDARCAPVRSNVDARRLVVCPLARR